LYLAAFEEMGAQCCSVAPASQKGVLQAGAAEGVEEGLHKFRETLKKSFKNPKDAWTTLHRDGDAPLSKEEFVEALKVAGKKAKWSQATLDFMLGLSGPLFDSMDDDGDGKLTYNEFKDILSKKMEGGEAGSPSGSPKGKKKQKFDSGKSRFDSNHSNQSADDGLADVLAQLRALLKKSFKDPKDAFKALDKDSDAKLDPEEFAKMLVSVGREQKWDDEAVTLLQSRARDIFVAMDVDLDGHVTREEFKKRLAAKC